MSLQDEFDKLNSEFNNFKTWLLHNVVTLKEFSTRYNELVDKIQKLSKTDQELQQTQQQHQNDIMQIQKALDNMQAPEFNQLNIQSAINQVVEQLNTLQQTNQTIFNNIQDEIASMQAQIAELTVRLDQLVDQSEDQSGE